MDTRRSFISKAALAGIAGIVACRKAPAFAENMGMIKIGQLGLGSHGFVGSFNNPPADFKGKVKCRPTQSGTTFPGLRKP